MDTQAKIDEMMTWEQVHEWAQQHEHAPWIETASIRMSGRKSLGLSTNPLLCPLACYLNEKLGAVHDPNAFDDWRVRQGESSRYERRDMRRAYYRLPSWAREAERKVDQISGDERMVWVSQQAFLEILEQVREVA